VSVGVWVRCGSRDDPSHRPGLAHFIEHLVFKGTGLGPPRRSVKPLTLSAAT